MFRVRSFDSRSLQAPHVCARAYSGASCSRWDGRIIPRLFFRDIYIYHFFSEIYIILPSSEETLFEMMLRLFKERDCASVRDGLKPTRALSRTARERRCLLDGKGARSSRPEADDDDDAAHQPGSGGALAATQHSSRAHPTSQRTVALCARFYARFLSAG